MDFNAVSLLVCLLALFCGAFGQETVEGQPCKDIRDGYFVRDKSSCMGYFYCYNETATALNCPTEYYFNEVNQNCDYPENVECYVCENTADFYVVAHPTNCSQFYICNQGHSSVGLCSEGYSFDARSKVCNPSERVNCIANGCPLVDEPNKIVYMASKERCDEYFICQAGVPIKKQCAPSLYWNPTTEQCDLVSNVICNIPEAKA